MSRPQFDYSRLTDQERTLLRSYGSLSDEEVWRRAERRDPIAWLEAEARQVMKRHAWEVAGGPGPEPRMRFPQWVRLAHEARRRAQLEAEEPVRRRDVRELARRRAEMDRNSLAYYASQKGGSK